MPIATLDTTYSDNSLLNTKSIGGSPASTYQEAVVNYIKRKENDPLANETSDTSAYRIHLDSEGIPTFGYGYNLTVHDGSDFELLIEHAYGGTLPTTDIQTAVTFVSEWMDGGEVTLSDGSVETLTEADLIDAANGVSTISTELNVIQQLAPTEVQHATMLDGFLFGIPGIVGLDQKLTTELGTVNIADSEERIALLSQYYANPSLIGAGLKSALAISDPDVARADAWFELAYNHLDTGESGLMNRRFEEADDLFGLTGEYASSQDTQDAIEKALSHLFNGDGGSVYSTIEARDTIVEFETAISDELNSVKAFYNLDAGYDVQFVQRDADGQDAIITAKSALENTGPTNNLILGKDGNDSLVGGDGDDYLNGGVGDDTLSSGTGQDTLAGDEGDDLFILEGGPAKIDGGDGNDTLVVKDNGAAIDLTVKDVENIVILPRSGDVTIKDDGSDRSNAQIFLPDDSSLTDVLSSSLLIPLIGGIGDNDSFTPISSTMHFVGNDLGWGFTLVEDDLWENAGDDPNYDDYERAYFNVDLDYTLENGGLLIKWEEDSVILQIFIEGFVDGDFGISLEDSIPIDDLHINQFNSYIGQFNSDSQPVTFDSLLTGEQSNPNEGTTGDDELSGSEGADTLDGDAGNDLIEGLGGDDSILGGSGDDTISGGTGNDTLDGGDGIDTVTYDYSTADFDINLATGDGGGETISNFENAVGSKGDNIITGSAVANYLDGNDGNDNIVGGAGDDTIAGGSGDDTLDGGSGNDTVVYSYAAVDFDINLSTGLAAGETITSFENAVGSTGANNIIGTSGANDLNGHDGDDTLDGGAGNDTLTGGDGADVFVLQAGWDEDTISDFSLENDLIDLRSANLGFQDLTITQVGIDTLLEYGAGNSVTLLNVDASLVTYKNFIAVIQGTGNADLLEGNRFDDTIWGAAGHDTIEGLAGNDILHGEDGDDYLYGGDGDDSILGGAGSDLISGGFGLDTLDGGAGTDTITYSYSAGDFDINLTSGNASNESISNFENVIGSEGANTITGSADANKLEGLGGNDTLKGEGGNDTLLGGDGNDLIAGGFGIDIQDGGAGIDTIDFTHSSGHASINLVTGEADFNGTIETFSNFENIKGTLGNNLITGDGNDNYLFGSNGHDTLLGADGNDRLYGGNGNDSIVGGDGNDLLNGYLGNDIFNGGVGNDTLQGDGGNDTLLGGDGNDFIAGGSGIDVQDGGAGVDTIDFKHSSSNATISLVTGEADFSGTIETFSNFENVEGTLGDNLITGDSGDNYLFGSDGNDTLLGGDGNDSLYGGNGADSIVGGNGDDILHGFSGDDTLDGGAGFDTADFSYTDLGATITLATDTVTFSEGSSESILNIEAVIGTTGNDAIIGDGSANKLDGSDGIDTINGGAGDDTLVGGAGNDSFKFENGWGNDLITDFDAGSEMLDMSATSLIYADLTITQVSSDTLIEDGSGNSILLQGINSSDIDQTDFAF